MTIKYEKDVIIVSIDKKVVYVAKDKEDSIHFFDIAPWRPLTSDFWYYETLSNGNVVTHCKFDYTYLNDCVKKACALF